MVLNITGLSSLIHDVVVVVDVVVGYSWMKVKSWRILNLSNMTHQPTAKLRNMKNYQNQ